MSANHIKTLAIIGASGNVGSSTLRNLLAINTSIKITIISRQDSKATFPTSPQITIQRGDYSSEDFLLNAFKGNEAVMFALAFGQEEAQTHLIEIAIKAGVEWVIPNEYAGNGLNSTLVSNVPLFQPKKAARDLISSLSSKQDGKQKAKWIGIATNPWTELSLRSTLFGINVPSHTARLYTDSGRFNTSSMNQVGLGIAKLLSLPITNPSNPRASLEHYADNFAYISSFYVTQSEIFDAVKTATGTKNEDWKIERMSILDEMKINREKFEGGDFFAGAALTYGYYMGEGLGGDFEEKAKEDREVLGLKEEDLVDVVKKAVA